VAARALEIEADSGGVRLAGTLWRPEGDAVAGALMHPGSGPSDRDNDVLFPPIREQLLEAGIAVCSFDKRGVGGSAGSWLDAGITEQADDLLAGLAAFEANSPHGLPLGLFGHSQGGWVVVEAAARGFPIAFVITNSGPGVSPARQERYSLANKLAAAEEAEALATYDAVVAMMRERPSLGDGLAQLDAAGVPYRELPGLEFMFEDAAIWRLLRRDLRLRPGAGAVADHGASPRALRRGRQSDAARGERRRVPRRGASGVAPDRGLPGRNHRLHHGEPPRFVDGYLDRIASFVRAVGSGTLG
jgi:uncharacterized protein